MTSGPAASTRMIPVVEAVVVEHLETREPYSIEYRIRAADEQWRGGARVAKAFGMKTARQRAFWEHEFGHHQPG
jgi:hypothetical protein